MDDSGFETLEIFIVLVKHESADNSFVFHMDQINDPLFKIFYEINS